MVGGGHAVMVEGETCSNGGRGGHAVMVGGEDMQ